MKEKNMIQVTKHYKAGCKESFIDADGSHWQLVKNVWFNYNPALDEDWIESSLTWSEIVETFGPMYKVGSSVSASLR